MTRDDAEALIRRYYAAFDAQDVDGMVACLSAEFVHDVNEGERRGGHERFRQFLARMNRCYRERLTDLVVMTDERGVRAAAEFVIHGTYLETDGDLPPARGQAYVLPVGAFFELKPDGIARVTTRYNLSDWIAQVKG